MLTKRLSVKDIQNLYFNQGLSAQQTASRLGKSISQIYKFMSRHNLPRRTFAQTRKIQFQNSPLSFNRKEYLTYFEKQLRLAALMLYWAEGYKSGLYVDFVNSNPEMIKIFLLCLRTVYGVKEGRIRILLYCYLNQDVGRLVNFWSRVTRIPLSQFTQPYVRNDFNIEKTGRMPYGLVHIRYGDRRLYEQIMLDIDKISKEFSRDGRAVKYTSL